MFVVCMNYFTLNWKKNMQNVHFGNKKKNMHCVIAQRNSSQSEKRELLFPGWWVSHLTCREDVK